MPNQLHNILVPVDFTGRNKWAINKAIEISNSYHCNIHLVYVLHKRILPFLPIERTWITPYESGPDLFLCRQKLKHLKAIYQRRLSGAGTVEISILEGSPHRQLTNYVLHEGMDLVVMGVSRFNILERLVSSITMGRLARRTSIPVMFVSKQSSGSGRKFAMSGPGALVEMQV